MQMMAEILFSLFPCQFEELGGCSPVSSGACCRKPRVKIGVRKLCFACTVREPEVNLSSTQLKFIRRRVIGIEAVDCGRLRDVR